MSITAFGDSDACYGAVKPRHIMQVVRLSAGTSDRSIGKGKALRLLDIGTLVEILEGPVHVVDDHRVRVRAKVIDDDVEYWIMATIPMR